MGVSENQGGIDNCVWGSSGDDTRIDIHNSGGGLVLQQSKGDGGGFSISWPTVNLHPNGTYTIRSYGRNITNGFFKCNTGSYYLISQITVNLQNRAFLDYVGATDVYHGENVTAAARVTLENGASNVGGRTVSFSIDGQAGSVSAVTNSSGVATATIPVTRLPGNTTVRASYGGDSFFTGASDAAGLIVLPRPTALSYTGATSGRHSGTATLSARLTDVRAGTGIEGETVHFSLGSFSADAQTGPDGSASVEAPLTQDPGAYTVQARFDGDDVFVASSASAGFEIGWEYVFADDDGAGTLSMNTTTKQFRFASAAEDTGIKSDPGMIVVSAPAGADPTSCLADPTTCGPAEASCEEITVATGCEEAVVQMAFMDATTTVLGTFHLESGAFTATVVTPSSVYTLKHTAPAPDECVEDPLGGDPICTP